MDTLAIIGFGQTELIIFLVIVLILFGKRLPGAMFSVGKSITEFKKGVNDTSHEEEPEIIEERTAKKAE